LLRLSTCPLVTANQRSLDADRLGLLFIMKGAAEDQKSPPTSPVEGRHGLGRCSTCTLTVISLVPSSEASRPHPQKLPPSTLPRIARTCSHRMAAAKGRTCREIWIVEAHRNAHTRTFTQRIDRSWASRFSPWTYPCQRQWRGANSGFRQRCISTAALPQEPACLRSGWWPHIAASLKSVLLKAFGFVRLQKPRARSGKTRKSRPM